MSATDSGRTSAARRLSHADSAVDELANRADDGFLLSDGELAVDRQREAFGGRPFGFRKVSATMTEIGETGLHVERDGVVDLRADAALVEMGPQAVAIADADHELVIDVPAIGWFGRQPDV